MVKDSVSFSFWTLTYGRGGKLGTLKSVRNIMKTWGKREIVEKQKILLDLL